jgi:flavorubredoxin
MKACVIFDSRYGNVEKIASSFETGLKEVGIQTVCVNAKVVNIESLKEYDLIAVGGPTEKITASGTIKDFLAKLEGMDFNRKFGFAFDIKLGYPLTGSAAKFIESKLENLGLEIISEKASAIVVPQKKKRGDREWYHEEYFPLKDGEEKRFEDLGHQIGTSLLTSGKAIKAEPLLQNSALTST